MNSKVLGQEATFLLKTVTALLNQVILEQHQTIVVGLSGGPDSVALLHVLRALAGKFNYRLIAAHLDHEWRAESGRDVLFCQQLCDSLGIDFIAAKATALKIEIKYNGSKEEVGRKLRRYFLTKVATQYQAQHIALAHHLDDQIETFFINLIRGSSLSGLGGMKTQSTLYLRPLLQITKIDILAYLNANQLTHLEDITNNCPLFLRNRIRTLLPAMTKIDTRFKPNFTKTLIKIQQANYFLENLAKTQLAQITQGHKLNLKQLFELDPFLQKQIILQWLYQHKVPFIQTEKFVDEILKFFSSTHGGTHQLSPKWLISKKQNLVEVITVPLKSSQLASNFL